MNASLRRAERGIPPLMYWSSNRTGRQDGTVSGGQFDWGGRLPKSNGGAQRYPQAGWKPVAECKGKGCLTARRTGRAGTKVGLSDPAVLNGKAVAQRIKATLGITG